MSLFRPINITSSDIGGAVAETLLHDLRVNGLGLDGFPQVIIERPDNDRFQIVLQFGENKRDFFIFNSEAISAVKLMKSNKGYDSAIFDRVQEAIAQLEGASRQT